MKFEVLREKIDTIDDELLRLFEERMDVVAEIAAYKQGCGLPVLDQKREAAKHAAIAGKVRPENEPYAHILYDTLFELSRRYQRHVR